MKATLKLEDGREIQVEVSENDVVNLTKPNKKTGWERLGEYDEYYSIDTCFSVKSDEDYGIANDIQYKLGNYFSDEQLASDQSRAISLWLRIKRWAAEHCEPMN